MNCPKVCNDGTRDDDGREDLDAMDEAMVEAKTAGVNEAAAYMVESSILKDRGEKQLEAQTMLTQALASLSKSKMRGASFGGRDDCFFVRLLLFLILYLSCCLFFQKHFNASDVGMCI